MYCRRVVAMEQEVEVEAEVLGSGWPRRRAVRGGRSVVVYFLKNAIGCVSKQGLKRHLWLMTHSFQKWNQGRGGGWEGEVGGCLPQWSCMVRISWNVSQIMLLCFRNVVSQRQSLKEFGMHCYAFVMLYLKDGPLRRSSECIAMLS